MYKLEACIQHTGTAMAGHYLVHLNFEDQFYTVNDDKKVQKSTQSQIESSQIFHYRTEAWMIYFIKVDALP